MNSSGKDHISSKKAFGFIWLLLSVLFQTVAQVFGKQAALVSRGNGLMAMVLNGWYLMELISLFCQALCWAMVLRSFPLFFAYPFMSLVIVLNLMAAWLIFSETVSLNHICGIISIMIGIIIVSRKEK